MRMKVLAVCLIALAVLVAASGISSAEATFVVSGTVSDTASAIVAGATVDLIRDSDGTKVQTTTTNDQGAYSFTVPAGSYSLMASKLFYQPSEIATANVVDANVPDVNMVIEALTTYHLTGKVLDTNGDGVAGVEVSCAAALRDLFTTMASNTTSGSDGSYDLLVVKGYCNVSARKLEYILTTDPSLLKLNIQGNTTLNLQVKAVKGYVSGKVVTSDNTLPSGFVVVVKNVAGAVLDVATTGNDGTYKILVPAGDCSVSAVKAGYVTMPGPQAVTVVAPAVSTLADFVATPSIVMGILKDSATGKPIYNGIVQAGGASDVPTIKIVIENGQEKNVPVRRIPGGPVIVTDEDGAFCIPCSGCGGVELFGDALGYRCTDLFVAGTGVLYKDITLVAQAEPNSIKNGDMEQVSGGQPTNWVRSDWNPLTDFSASTNARHGLYSLFDKPQSIDSEYGGVKQEVTVTPGRSYNFYFRAKADPELLRFFPQFEWYAPGDNPKETFTSADPLYWGYSHNPPKQWHQYYSFQESSYNTFSGPGARVTVPAGVVTGRWIFLHEWDDAYKAINGTRMPPAGKGYYVDDVVIDAVDPTTPVPTTSGVSTVPTVASIEELKSQPVGTMVRLTGSQVVTFAPKRPWDSKVRATDFFYIGEKKGLGALRVADRYFDTLSFGDIVTNLVGTVKKTAAGEVYLQLAGNPAGGAGIAGTAIAPIGVNNKAVATDAKLQTNTVRVWGKVAYANDNAPTCTINDGYGSPITVDLNLSFLSAKGAFNGKTAVITGVVSKDDTGKTVILCQSVNVIY